MITEPAPQRRRGGRAMLTAVLLVLGWLVVGALAGPASGRLAEVQKNDNASFLPADAESTTALAQEREFGDTEALPTLVVYEREGGLTAADRADIARDVTRLADVDGLAAPPSPPVPSRDGEAVQVVLLLDATDFQQLPVIVAAIRDVLAEPGGPTAYVTGVGGLSADLIDVFGEIDTTLLLATAIVVVVILLVVYRSPVLWALPLLSVGLAYSLAAGIIHPLAKNDVLTLDGTSQGILTVLVFGAGTDYALLLIARYREELHRHRRASAAMAAALRGAIPPIAASAATVVLGLLCLMFSELNSNRGLGPVSAIGIGAAFLAMTTLLPALLVLAGRRVFWPRVPRFVEGQHVESGPWDRVAAAVGRRSRLVAVLTGGALLLLTLGATQLQTGNLTTTELFIGDVESVAGQEALSRHYPGGTGSPATVLGPADAADELLTVVRGVPGVAGAELATGTGAAPQVVDGRVLVRAVLAEPVDSVEAASTVERLRTAVDRVSTDVVVGGFTAVDVDVRTAAGRDRRVIIPLVLLVILLVLCVLLRSLVAPLLLVATVVLSFGATLGVCALVFRHVFGFAGTEAVFPLFAFVFLVALGIDYNIFLMTRVREEALRLGTRAGTLRGLALTGGVITSAGVVLAATFSVLGVLPLVVLAELGFAVAFGVLLDTFVVRSLLVPALALEVGPRIWWPSALSDPRRGGQGGQPGLEQGQHLVDGDLPV